MCESKFGGAWAVLLFAASVAAWERLAVGEASLLALWILGVWTACRSILWLFQHRAGIAKFRAGSASLVQLFALAFRRNITRAERS